MFKTEAKRRKRILEEAVKDGSYEKWLNFGNRLLKRFYWGESFEKLNCDIVHELIEKILTGVHAKNWDHDKVNINQIMYMNIFGTINKMNKEMQRRKITRDNFAKEAAVVDPKDKLKYVPNFDNLKHLTLAEVENDMNKKEYFKLFEAHLAGDEECLKIFYGIKGNEFRLHDNEEIGRKLGMKKRVVENAKRRFNRTIQSFRKKGYDRMFNSEGKEIKQ